MNTVDLKLNSLFRRTCWLTKKVDSLVNISSASLAGEYFDDALTSNGSPVIRTGQASVSLTGNVVYELVDDYTGELVSFSKITTKPDGLSYTDSDIDGVIIRKKGNNYYQRSFTGKANAAWFGLKSDNTNQKTIFDKIFSQVNAKDITIPKGTYKISTNITFPEGYNISFENGASLTVDTSIAITLKSKVIADYRQYIFQGLGTVNLYATSCDFASVCWYGAKGDSTLAFDSGPAIQKCIFAAERVWKIYIPGFGAVSPYYVSSTIEVRSPTYSFAPFEVYGDGFAASTGSTSSYPQTTQITYGGTQKACFNIIGARNTRVHDISFLGQVTELATASTTNIDTRKESYWVGTTYSSDIVNHHCAISFDGPSTTVAGSNNSRIYNCQFKQFIVGVSISANGGTQGDTMYVNNNVFVRCAYAISTGNSQNRSSHFDYNLYDRIFTVFTNTRFGSVAGGSRFSILGGQVTNTYQIFDLAGQVGGNADITGLYVEGSCILGKLGSSSNTEPSMFSFTGCCFKFQDNGWADDASNTQTEWFNMKVGAAVVIFNGGQFLSLRKLLVIACNGDTYGQVRFNSVTFTGSLEEVAPNREGFVTFESCAWKNLKIDQNRTIRLDFTNSSALSRSRIGNSTQFAVSSNVAETQLNDKTAFIARRIINRKTINLTTCTINSDDGTNVSITWPNNSTFNGLFGNVMVGDYMQTLLTADSYNATREFYNSGVYAPSLIVTAIDYTTRTIVVKRLAFEALITSTSSIQSTWKSTVYSKPISCSITNGSASVTNVTNISILAVGDCVTFEKSEYTPYRIATIDTPSTTITLTQVYAGVTNPVASLQSAPLVLLDKDIIQKGIPSVLTDATTIATDASLGNIFNVTLGGNRTMGAPTNPTPGQRLAYRISQDATGSRTLAWNSIFRWNSSIPLPTLSTSANALDFIEFIYNGIDTKWDAIRVVKTDAAASGGTPVQYIGGDFTDTSGLGFIGLPKQTSNPSAPSDGSRVFVDANGYLSLIKADGTLKPIIRDTPEQDYIGTITLTSGTALPTTPISLRYRWSQKGKEVKLEFAFLWTTVGTSAGMNFPLPTDMPLPSDWTGITGNVYGYTGAGSVTTSATGTGATARVDIRKNSGTSAVTIYVTYTSASIAYCKGSIFYTAQ